MNKEDKKIFAKDFCFSKYFWIFIIGCIAGAYWEKFYVFITNYLDHGAIVIENRQGLIYGPLNPVYGAGAVLLTYIFGKQKMVWWKYILYGGVIGGCFEYLLSFIQEKLTGTVSWDYSYMFLNINGRTNITYMLFWGFITMIWIMYLLPKISKLIESIPYKIGKFITIIAVILMGIDMIISWSACLRQAERRKGNPPGNAIEVFYDKYYPDELIEKYFGPAKIKN